MHRFAISALIVVIGLGVVLVVANFAQDESPARAQAQEAGNVNEPALEADVAIELREGQLADPGTPNFSTRGWATDFNISSVPFSEILSGGVPKDGIPALDAPVFESIEAARGWLDGVAPVISLEIDGVARAYPLAILTWHEIVNDELAGTPVTVTFCPLCHTALVYDRNLDGTIHDFGVSGNLRFSDMVMYDRQTETWWQQFLGEGLIGELTGARLKMIPSRLESFAEFKARAAGADAQVLVPARGGLNGHRNPYVGYDSNHRPFLYRGPLPEGIPALARVVRVGGEAWSVALLRRRSVIETGELRLTWRAGQNSALDTSHIPNGKDVGTVVVQRRVGEDWEDTVYSVDFAFAFTAFYPDGVLHLE